MRPPPPSTLFPYTTLFRSAVVRGTPSAARPRLALAPLPGWRRDGRSEEHTSELQSRGHLVCRLLLEKKKTPKWSYFFVITYSTVSGVVSIVAHAFAQTIFI